jgi:hypothetical protein
VKEEFRIQNYIGRLKDQMTANTVFSQKPVNEKENCLDFVSSLLLPLVNIRTRYAIIFCLSLAYRFDTQVHVDLFNKLIRLERFGHEIAEIAAGYFGNGFSKCVCR